MVCGWAVSTTELNFFFLGGGGGGVVMHLFPFMKEHKSR